VFENLPAPQRDETPRTMEFYGQSRGVTLYRTMLPAGAAGELSVKAVHDFGWVFLDGKQVGVLDRRGQRYRVELSARAAAARLEILIEAVGRVNFGAEVYDRKGLLAPVQFTPVNGTATELRGWEICPLQLDEAPPKNLKFGTEDTARGPAFWCGQFVVVKPGDTFLDLQGWGKGVVWVNGHCLGRFWNIGPTQTMYLPGPWLKAGANEVVVLDLIGPGAEATLAGLTKPILDELHPELDFARRIRPADTFDAKGLAPVASGAFTNVVEWQSVRFERAATGRYLCFEALNSQDGRPQAAMAELEAIDPNGAVLSKSAWKILWVSSEEVSELAGEAENILDGQPSSFWHSAVAKTVSTPPHRIVIDLGGRCALGGLRYLPRAGKAETAGRIKDFKIYLSDTPFGLSVR